MTAAKDFSIVQLYTYCFLQGRASYAQGLQVYPLIYIQLV